MAQLSDRKSKHESKKLVLNGKNIDELKKHCGKFRSRFVCSFELLNYFPVRFVVLFSVSGKDYGSSLVL